MLGELSFLDWDIICLSETRLPSIDEVLCGDHRLLANLSIQSVSDTAILIHQRHVTDILKKQSVGDRIMSVDFKFGFKLIRVIAVYLPHAGYP